MDENNFSPRSRFFSFILCLFFGWAGLHRFYVHKTGTGLAMFFTMGGFGMWWFLDTIMIFIGAFKDSEERIVSNWGIDAKSLAEQVNKYRA